MFTTKIIIKNKICGILTLPSIQGKFQTVLFLHGFASNKNEVKNIFQYMAEKLSAKDIASLRIDFQCWGESSGQMEDSTIDTMVGDAIESIEFLKRHSSINSENISIIGFSLGAAIGILTTEYILCRSLILISPPLHLIDDFNKFLGDQNMLRLKESKYPIEIKLPWLTVKLKNDFYVSLSKYNCEDPIKAFSGFLHCIVGKNDFTYTNAAEIYRMAKTSNKLLTIVDQADHIFSRPDGSNVLKETVDDIISNFLMTPVANQAIKCRM